MCQKGHRDKSAIHLCIPFVLNVYMGMLRRSTHSFFFSLKSKYGTSRGLSVHKLNYGCRWHTMDVDYIQHEQPSYQVSLKSMQRRIRKCVSQSEIRAAIFLRICTKNANWLEDVDYLHASCQVPSKSKLWLRRGIRKCVNQSEARVVIFYDWLPRKH